VLKCLSRRHEKLYGGASQEFNTNSRRLPSARTTTRAVALDVAIVVFRQERAMVALLQEQAMVASPQEQAMVASPQEQAMVVSPQEQAMVVSRPEQAIQQEQQAGTGCFRRDLP
jgi:hypothetical protein